MTVLITIDLIRTESKKTILRLNAIDEYEL